MKLTDLEYFNKLVDLASFSKTAAFFNVSQPTISYAVQRLEQEFQQNLIIRSRSHGRVQLTKAGQLLQMHGQKIMQDILAAHEEIDRLALPTLEFGLPQIIGNFYFPKLIKHFINSAMFQNISTHEAGSGLLLKALQKHQLDMALLSSIETISMPGWQTVEIDRRQYKIVVNRRHRLAKQKKVAFADLKDENFVALKEGFVHPIAFRQLEEKYRIFPKIIYESPDINIIKKLVAENAGIAFLAEIAVSPADKLATIEIDADKPPEFIISLVYRQDLQMPEIDHFAYELKKEVAKTR